MFGICLAAAMWLGSSTLALAGPAGSEYLPNVPSATGHHANASGQGGGGQAQSGGITTTDTTSTETTGSSKPAKSKSTAPKDKKDQRPTPAASTDTTSSDGGSSGLLIVLLIIAGVILVAVGMTFRHRQGGDAGSNQEPGERQLRGDQSNTPRTPDGEIVADPDKAA